MLARRSTATLSNPVVDSRRGAARIGGVNNRIVPIHFIDCVNLIRSSHYDLDIRKTYDAIGRNTQIGWWI